MRNQGLMLTRKQLLENVWGWEHDGSCWETGDFTVFGAGDFWPASGRQFDNPGPIRRASPRA
jgi:hypothetical protein